MIILLKKIFFASFLILLFNITNSYSQSENEKITNLIEQKRAFNKNTKNSKIYKIQLYNGNETQAYKIKRNFETAFPNYKTKIIYKSPEWKTQVGNFNSRIEADRILNIIKEKFIGAIVLEDKI